MADSAFGCSECGSQRFLTNESQELVCEDCGTLCQLTLPESHDEPDAMQARGKTGRAYRLRKGEDRPEETKADDVNVRDCLLAYQYILQAFAKALVLHEGFPPALQEVVEEQWWCYLEEWTATAKYPILQCFLQAQTMVGEKALQRYDTLPGVKEFRRRRRSTLVPRRERRSLDNAILGVTATEDESEEDEEEEQESEGEVEEDRRSRQSAGVKKGLRRMGEAPYIDGELSVVAPLDLKLSLGFVEAGCRQLRLGVLGAHVLRWVEDGTLPYFQAWQLMPPELWRRLERVWPFFVDRHLLVAHTIPTFTARLVDGLRLTLPEPNLVLTCRRLVRDLGLPRRLAYTCTALLDHHKDAKKGIDRVKEAGRVGDRACSFWELVWKHAEDPAVPMALVLLAARLDATWQHWALRRGAVEGEDNEEEEEERRLVECGEEALDLDGRGLSAYVQYVMDVVLGGEALWLDDENHRRFLENLAEGGDEYDDPGAAGATFHLPPPQLRAPCGESVCGPPGKFRVYSEEDKNGPPVDEALWALVEHGARMLELPPAYVLLITLQLDNKLLNGGPKPRKRKHAKPLKWWDKDVHLNLKWAQRFAAGMEWEGAFEQSEEEEEQDGEGETGSEADMVISEEETESEGEA